MRPASLLPALVLLLPARAAAAADNPRNRVWDAPVIEWVERLDEGLVVHLRNPASEPRRVLLEGADALELPARGTLVARLGVPVGDDRPVLRLHAADRALLDTFSPRPDEAFTVGLLVERRTLEAGNRRFGSFVRRMRQSFEDLEALLADVGATTPRSLLAREAAVAPFRILHVEVYDRADAERPPLFDEHPGLDLVIACDEGGPLAGFWLPQYAIGHNFLFAVGDGASEERRGLWSAWGEQALWHEVLHFRGVPDAYVFHVPAAALPGRAVKDVSLPDTYRLGLRSSPYQPPRVSALTAAVVNAKRGVARVGACEEPDYEQGHMWRWVPARLELEVTKEDVPLADVRVRHWRSRPLPALRDDRRQGVPRDAPPEGRGAVLEGDYVGRADARPRRSLFLLIEVEHDRETRWGLILLLELNEAWAAGRHTTWRRRVRWEDLRPRAG